MKAIVLILAISLVGCAPIPIKRYKTNVVDQTPCYQTNDCPMQNPPAFLFYNNFNNSWRR